MPLKSLVMMVGLATLPVLIVAPQAWAQMPSPAQSTRSTVGHPPASRRMRPRIEINPRPLLYRRCTDWYELQYRPSGKVLFPQMRCWWVRG